MTVGEKWPRGIWAESLFGSKMNCVQGRSENKGEVLDCDDPANNVRGLLGTANEVKEWNYEPEGTRTSHTAWTWAAWRFEGAI